MITAKMSAKDMPEDSRILFGLFIGDDTADKIELKYIERVAKELGENVSDDELNEVIVRANTDIDGELFLSKNIMQLWLKKYKIFAKSELI